MMHPELSLQIAHERRRDLVRQADRFRLARQVARPAARPPDRGRPAPRQPLAVDVDLTGRRQVTEIRGRGAPPGENPTEVVVSGGLEPSTSRM